MDIKQNLCVKYVPVTGDEEALIQTENTDYIYSRRLLSSVNNAVFSAGRHFVLNEALRLECSIEITVCAMQPRFK